MVFAAGLTLSIVMPTRNQRSSVPIQRTVADERQRIAEHTQRIEMIATAARLCAIVASTFFLRTMPE